MDCIVRSIRLWLRLTVATGSGIGKLFGSTPAEIVVPEVGLLSGGGGNSFWSFWFLLIKKDL